MPFAAVLLDLDGTLLDTIPDLANASNGMRLELGLPPLSRETIASYVGKGTENLVLRTLSNNPDGSTPDAGDVRQGLEIFGRHYHAVNGDQAVLFLAPGQE
ncbi:MAG: HAD hydrolase-like protein, partial [Pollutimonas bauzanensis]